MRRKGGAGRLSKVLCFFVSNHATRGVVRTILCIGGVVTMSLALIACAPRSEVSPQRRRMAVQLVDRGTLLLREKRFTEAQAAFEAAYELAPLPAALDGQGCSAFHRGDLIGAEQLFRQAYSMDVNYDEALANLGLVLALQGRGEEASAVYRSYLARRPDAAHVRNNLIVLEYERGEATMRVVSELRKASLLTNHGVIAENLRTLEGSSDPLRRIKSGENVSKNGKHVLTKTNTVR
jgi:Flp pilus assembly protein TadD